MNVPGDAPMLAYYPDPPGAPYAPSPRILSPRPIEMQLTEVPPTQFCPFYPEGPQTEAHSTDTMPSFTVAAAATAASAIANPVGNENNEDEYAQLLSLAGTQQPTWMWGANRGERYILEEKDVGVFVPSAMDVWTPDNGAMQRYVMGA
jgi:hypothetical protein